MSGQTEMTVRQERDAWKEEALRLRKKARQLERTINDLLRIAERARAQAVFKE